MANLARKIKKKAVAQWESGLLITSKKSPSYYLRLPDTGKKHQITFASSQ